MEYTKTYLKKTNCFFNYAGFYTAFYERAEQLRQQKMAEVRPASAIHFLFIHLSYLELHLIASAICFNPEDVCTCR